MYKYDDVRKLSFKEIDQLKDVLRRFQDQDINIHQAISLIRQIVEKVQ